MEFGLIVLVVVSLVLISDPGGLVDAQSNDNCGNTHDGRPGTCISIRDCPHLRKLLLEVKEGTAPEGSTDLLRKVICRFVKNEPRVCCSEPASSEPTSPPSKVSFTRSTSVLPATCGIRSLEDRIIDGENAPLTGWPWMAVLRGTSTHNRNKKAWFCGGSLISDSFVLTAAHCFKQEVGVDVEFVRLGEHNIKTEEDCELGICAPPVQDIQIERIIQHPDYDVTCPECHDLALIKLARPATIHTRFVAPICLPINPERDMGFSVQEFIGKSAFAAGWGTTAKEPGVTRIPSILQQVELPLQELNYCRVLRARYPNDEMVICAGGEGKDTCRGDSGGPLTLTNKVKTKTFLIGVTSLGPTICGTLQSQGLYSSVHYYLDWIINTMQQNL